MDEIATTSSEITTTAQSNTSYNLIELTEDLLTDARNNIKSANTISMPIAELSTLGAGVASLLPALRTVTQTMNINTAGLFRVANANTTDILKIAKDGNFWGALKTADGASKMAKFQSADPLSAVTSTVVPIDPTTMMIAVALFSIEKKLDDIERMQKELLSFLEIEKESAIESDVQMLSDIIKKHKTNWDNSHYLASNHKLVLDIQRAARQNLNSYQKKLSDLVHSKSLVLVHTQVDSLLSDCLKKFKYYRLSLYSFSLASMLEIMLSGNFKEEYISGIQTEIETMSETYRNLFEDCSVYLEKMSKGSIDINVLKGIGSASNAVGKFVGSIPLVKKGPVDEFLQDSGKQLKSSAKGLENRSVKEFARMNNPETRTLIDKMNDMIQIFNHTREICFDDKQIYLITDTA